MLAFILLFAGVIAIALGGAVILGSVMCGLKHTGGIAIAISGCLAIAAGKAVHDAQEIEVYKYQDFGNIHDCRLAGTIAAARADGRVTNGEYAGLSRKVERLRLQDARNAAMGRPLGTCATEDGRQPS